MMRRSLDAPAQPAGARRSSASLRYRPPVLRCHGTLRDLTVQKASTETQKSDVHAKENFLAVAWG